VIVVAPTPEAPQAAKAAAVTRSLGGDGTLDSWPSEDPNYMFGFRLLGVGAALVVGVATFIGLR
jgi:hypothetical protein